MASFSSILVYNVVFLLVSSVVLVSASTDHRDVVGSILPSLEIGALTDDTFTCDLEGNTKVTQGFDLSRGCNVCLIFCMGACAGRLQVVNMKCRRTPQDQTLSCDCCCKKPASPPPPPPCICPAPTPPPPCSPPPPPPGDQCSTGDTYTETTIPTSNCADCTNWCTEDCSELGGRVIEDKCAIGESTYIRRCKCCCRGGKSAGPKNLLDLANTM